MTKNNFRLKITLNVVFVLIIIYCLYLFSNYQEQELKKCFKVTNALIVDIKDGYKSGLVLTYKYTVVGRTYFSHCNRSIKNTGLRNSLFNKNLVLVYSCKNPSDHKLMLYEEDFNEFEISYPDSLFWIKQELDKSW